MKIIENKSFEEERALYGSLGVHIKNCRFEGELDGESALKESENIIAEDCYFDLRYPFWHDKEVRISNCEMTEKCRAALWYTDNVKIQNSRLYGIKALRECREVIIEDSEVSSPEFGWFSEDVKMKNSNVNSEYFMLRANRLNFEKLHLNGKYSLQYIENSVFEDCNFNTKDAFWHAKNVVVKNSFVKGEYLGWYSENLTFENCVIIGTQPLCYCKGLKLINCRMEGCDLSFEKSEVSATIASHVDSIKNPASGEICVESMGELIYDGYGCRIFVKGKEVTKG